MFKRSFKPLLMAAMGSVALFAAAAMAAGASGKAALSFDFDQAQGTSLRDASGQGHDGRLENFTADDLVPGMTGNALRFNGVSSHVVIENAGGLAFPGQGFTLSLWIKPDKADGTILSKLSDATSSAGRYQLTLEKGVPQVRYRAGATKYARVAGDGPLALGQWHHLVVVFDAAGKQILLYVNGHLNKTDAWEGQTWGKADQPLYLGAHASSQVRPSYRGLMDDLQVIAGALPAQEIAARWTASQRALQAGSPWEGSDVMGYVIPPVSSTRWMADTVPGPQYLGDTIPMIAAKGEFESASFIVYPLVAIEKLEMAVSDLKGQQHGGVIPAANLSLRVVKRWYQSGNAWDGYPLQNRARRVLVPELLLHDEKLIRVDHEKQDNYLRLDRESGPEYVSVSYTKPGSYKKPVNVRHLGKIEFNYSQEPANDADTLQPVAFASGQAKQFWITLKTPADIAADQYLGEISLTADGRVVGTMKVQLRVLPYELPLPLTYYDLDRSYYIDVKNHVRYPIEFTLNGGSEERALHRMRTAYRNMLEHGGYEIANLYLYREFTEEDAKIFARTLEVLKESGSPLRRVMGGDAGPLRWWVPFKDEADRQAREAEVRRTVDTALKLIRQTVGLDPQNVYFYGTDEATGKKLIGQLPTWRYIQSTGAKIFTTGWRENIQTTAFSQDFHSQAGKPDPAAAAQWHALGNRISTYAYPFSGPEDPQLWRRNAGLLPYKANYDGFLCYIYFEGSMSNIWNDFLPGQYRGLNMVYPTRDGIVDTLAWEGFREGVDDVRYATLMKQLAAQAIASPEVDVRHVGKRALQWLALVDSETVDLDTARLEMIDHISKLRQALGKGDE